MNSSNKANSRRRNWLASTICRVVTSALVGAIVAVFVVRTNTSRWALPNLETRLMASAADANEGFAMATGLIDENVEGLFMLDGLTGELQVWVLNYRSGKFGAIFKRNVLEDMELSGKSPKFLLTTGEVQFRSSTFGRPGRSVAYVVETSTGKIAAYGVPWGGGRQATAGVAGTLILLDVGAARTAAIRE